MKASSCPLVVNLYSHRSFLLFCLATTYYAAYILVWLVRSRQNLGANSPEWITGVVAAFLRFLGVAFMWFIWSYKSTSNSPKERLLLFWMENSYHALIALSLALRVGTEVMVGQCPSNFSLSEYEISCNDFQEVNSVRPNYMVSLMVIPLLAYFFIRETRAESIAASWLIAVATLVFCAIQMKSQVLIYPIITYVCSSLMIFNDANRQNMDMLRLVAALRTTAEEVERLQEKSRATELRAMIGNVAHDLKTPLTSILSGIECIEEAINCLEREREVSVTSIVTASDPTTEVDRTQPASPHVNTVRACLKNMLGTSSFMTMCINRCLDYTKASKGVKLVPKPETVNLQEALDFPISIMRDVQTQLPITLAAVPGEICSHIITDKQWLMENVLCLLSNAVRYSQSGSVDINVSIYRSKVTPSDQLLEAPALLRFEVCDCGIGLTEEMMAALFAPFKQAQRLAGGTGLGLFSLAKRVEALRGEYGVCKRPDGCQGSMFWFSIPYRPDSISATPQHLSPAVSAMSGTLMASSASSWGTANTPCWSVLVVDDAPSILKMTTMLLTKKGHVVARAVNGAEAVIMIKRAADVREKEGSTAVPLYDVVLMDLQMPVMDGIEAIRRVRNDERGLVDLECGGKHRQLIIALSANSDSETMQEALDAGADHFISKPFAYETFFDFMSKQLMVVE